jgi:hypothetical protein
MLEKRIWEFKNYLIEVRIHFFFYFDGKSGFHISNFGKPI